MMAQRGAVAEESGPKLAGLLRQLRTGAGLTQEELAGAAGLSTRTVSDIERGLTATARKDSARLLADALGLTGTVRENFEAVARGRAPAGAGVDAGAGATRTLPRDIPSFTGRDRELRQLLEASPHPSGVVSIHAIGGMAGVGKTAFAVHVAHQLKSKFPDGQVFLPLHGHTPGQRPVEPADALASLLQTTGVAAQKIPPDTEARAGLWRDHLAGRKLLLVLDDAVDSDQVRPLLPGTSGTLVLVTSRRHLTALDDIRSISLDTLEPGEAAALLVRLAARPDMKPGDEEVGQLVRLTASLPLAVGIVAGQLHHHPSWTAADLAAELSTTQDRLELMVAENRSVAAAFGLSYARLTEAQQRLFRRLGLHPGPDVDAYAAAALDDAAPGPAGLAATRRALEALYDRYLLTEPDRGRYRFHDLIREHARTLAADDPAAERDAATARLAGYFLHAARLADRHLARHASAIPPGAEAAVPRHAPALATRQDAVTWMERERLNLQAAAAQAAQTGRPPGYVAAISPAMHGFLRVQGHWDQATILHELAIEAARQDGDRLPEAQARTELAAIKRLTGDYIVAAGHLEQAIAAFRELGSRRGEANALQQLGNIQFPAGDYPAAARSLTAAVESYRELGDRAGEGSTLRDLGAVQALTGDLPAATASLTRALEVVTDPHDRANALNYLGAMQRMTGDYPTALQTQLAALALHRQTGDKFGQASDLSELGMVQRLTGDYPAATATASESKALQPFRSVGNRLGEAAALGDLGLLRNLTEDYPAAVDNLRQALEIFRDLEHREGQASILNYLGTVLTQTGDHAAALDCLSQSLDHYTSVGHRQGQAEVLNSLGDAMLARARPRDARERYGEALDIAISISCPPEEACALEGIGRCQLLAGETAAGTRTLDQALAIYQRISSGNSERVSALLREQYR
jgi:tetratricopeptide (TPR) repeat protein/transcriptional regulator with XRE-family HTH domain